MPYEFCFAYAAYFASLQTVFYRGLAPVRFTRLRRLRTLALGPVSSVGRMRIHSNQRRNFMQGRPLTYDEQKAADAAFAGKPFNPDWSADAKIVYDGIVDALSACRVECELQPAGR